jgi:ABC-type phosphate transport system substrate-binding protein
MKIAKLSALLAAAALFTPGLSLADGFKLVVNSEQKTQKLTREEASRIFLKKVTRWSDGDEIRVVQPRTDSPVRRAFDPTVHKLPPAAIRAYWAQMVFSGRDIPPVEKSNDEAIVEFVKNNTGAIGVVSDGATLSGGVKVIELK